MRLLIVWILFIPMIASAGHHRLQAINNIANAKVQTNIAMNEMVGYASGCEFNSTQQTSIDVFFRYLSRSIDSMDKSITMLGLTNSDLDKVRRKLNEPGTDAGPGKISISVQFSGVLTRIRRLIGACPAQDNQLRKILQRLSNAWAQIDRAIWHVNDARTE